MYSKKVVNATCTTDGYTINICSCGKKYTDNVVKAGHIWTEATCEKAKKCKRCGVEEGTTLEHNYVKYVCTMCGEKDEEGYALAIKPELHLKKGELYSQYKVKSRINQYLDKGSLSITQHIFDENGNGEKKIQLVFHTEPREGASGEDLKPYVYNGVTYYKVFEMIDIHFYEIYGNDIVVFGESKSNIITVFNFNLDGELVEKPDYASGASAELGYTYRLGFKFD